MRFSTKQVLKRAKLADSRKEHWRGLLEDCYKYALPNRNLYSGHWEGRVPGQAKMEDVYDSTAINSVQRFANRIQSMLFPPYRNWCRLITGNDIPEDQAEGLQRALEIYNEKMFAVLRQTNFDLAISEMLLDLAAGTGIIKITGGDEVTPVIFEAVPQYLVSLEQGPHGKIDNVYRKMKLKAEAVPQQWPDAKLTPKMKRLVEEKPEEDIELLEATVYVPDEDYWCYHVIEPKEEEEIVYRELDSSPWVVCRYSVVSGEIMGRGPLISALPDIRSLNLTKKMLLQNASMSIAGMYTVADDGVISPDLIRIEPGAIIPVSRNGGPQGPSLSPLPKSGDFNLAQMVINDLQMSIKKTLLDDTMPLDTMSARSATEIGAKQNELIQQFSAAFGRLIVEALIPIVARVLKVMDEQNLIDLPLKVNGHQVKVVPISSMAKAQNQEELQSVLQFVQLIGQFGPIGQMALDPQMAIQFVADRMGVPPSILTTEEQRVQMAQAMQQQMAEVNEQQQGETPDGNEQPPPP
jgi:hypothetical protein